MHYQNKKNMTQKFQFNKNHCTIMFPTQITKKAVNAKIYYGHSNVEEYVLVSLDENYSIQLHTPLVMPRIEGDDVNTKKSKILSNIKLNKENIKVLKSLEIF